MYLRLFGKPVPNLNKMELDDPSKDEFLSIASIEKFDYKTHVKKTFYHEIDDYYTYKFTNGATLSIKHIPTEEGIKLTCEAQGGGLADAFCFDHEEDTGRLTDPLNLILKATFATTLAQEVGLAGIPHDQLLPFMLKKLIRIEDINLGLFQRKILFSSFSSLKLESLLRFVYRFYTIPVLEFFLQSNLAKYEKKLEKTNQNSSGTSNKTHNVETLFKWLCENLQSTDIEDASSEFVQYMEWALAPPELKPFWLTLGLEALKAEPHKNEYIIGALAFFDQCFNDPNDFTFSLVGNLLTPGQDLKNDVIPLVLRYIATLPSKSMKETQLKKYYEKAVAANKTSSTKSVSAPPPAPSSNKKSYFDQAVQQQLGLPALLSYEKRQHLTMEAILRFCYRRRIQIHTINLLPPDMYFPQGPSTFYYFRGHPKTATVILNFPIPSYDTFPYCFKTIEQWEKERINYLFFLIKVLETVLIEELRIKLNAVYSVQVKLMNPGEISDYPTRLTITFQCPDNLQITDQCTQTVLNKVQELCTKGPNAKLIETTLKQLTISHSRHEQKDYLWLGNMNSISDDNTSASNSSSSSKKNTPTKHGRFNTWTPSLNSLISVFQFYLLSLHVNIFIHFPLEQEKKIRKLCENRNQTYFEDELKQGLSLHGPLPPRGIELVKARTNYQLKQNLIFLTLFSGLSYGLYRLWIYRENNKNK